MRPIVKIVASLLLAGAVCLTMAGLGLGGENSDEEKAIEKAEKEEALRHNLASIGIALRKYALKNGGRLPASLEELVPTYLADKTSLWNPRLPKHAKNGADFVYLPFLRSTDKANYLVVWDTEEDADKKVWVLCLSGQVKQLHRERIQADGKEQLEELVYAGRLKQDELKTKTFVPEFEKTDKELPIALPPQPPPQEPEQKKAALDPQFGEPFTSGSMTLQIGYPFLYKDSVLTCMLHLCGSKVAGQQVDFVQCKITNVATGKGATDLSLRVEAALQLFSEPAVSTVKVKPGETVTLDLTPSFKDIGKITELRRSAIWTKVTDVDSGKVLYEQSKSVKVLSRNDLVISNQLFVFCSVFVTPNDKMVDMLVSHAAKRTPHGAMLGYQGSEEQVFAEAKAIYETIAALGVHYRSNTNSFINSTGGELVAQRVTFPAESILGAGANCIDGAVLFASAFENIGVESSIAFVPGHAFVVFRPSRAKDEIMPIECTMVGKASFLDAVVKGMEEYKELAKPGKMFLVKVAEFRKLGMTPFPFPVTGKKFPLDGRSGDKQE